MKAHYTKLKRGWGVRIHDPVLIEKDDEIAVDVERKDGRTRREKVKVIWIGKDKYTGNEIALCEIATPRKKKSKKSESTEEPAQ